MPVGRGKSCHLLLPLGFAPLASPSPRPGPEPEQRGEVLRAARTVTGKKGPKPQALGMGGGDSLQAPPTLGLGRLLTREGEPPLELFWCLAASLCYEALARMGRKPVWNPARSH